MLRNPFYFFLFLAIAFVTCEPEMIRGKNFQGFALSGEGDFKPEAGDIFKAEKALARDTFRIDRDIIVSFLQSGDSLTIADGLEKKEFIRDHLPEYYRQYVGTYAHGKKMITIFAAHRSFFQTDSVEAMNSFRKKILNVDGGGSIIWRAVYDAEKDSIVEWESNADM